MTEESKDNSSSSGSVGLTGMVEKLWLFVWMLRVLIVTLFIDVALVMNGQKSLLAKGLTTTVLAEPGIVLLTLCAFGIYVSVLAPATLQFFKIVRSSFPGTIDYRAPQYSSGYMRAHQVRELAMMTENQFWLTEYEKHAKKNSAGQRSAHTVALLLWTALILAGFEVSLSLRDSSYASLLVPTLFDLPAKLEHLALVLLALLGVLWGTVICLDLSKEDEPMYCPPYAAEEYRKQREAKQQQLDFEARLRRDMQELKTRDADW